MKQHEASRTIKVYQDEILKVTEQCHLEVAELQKQIMAKNSEVEFQKNNLKTK